MPDRKHMPGLNKVAGLNLKDPVSFILSNGMDVYEIKGGQEEVTRIDIVFEAGSAYQNKKLVAGSVNSLLKEGTEKYSSAEIAGILDYYGAYLNTHYTKDTAVVTLLTLTKHLDKLLPLLGDLLTNSVFKEQELEIYLNREKQRFLVNIEKVKYLASLEFNKIVFGSKTRYGQVLSKDDFDKITREDIIEFYNNYYCPENAYAVVSGHINKETEELLNKFIGNISCKGKAPDSSSLVFYSEPDTKEKYIEKENALQSAIRVGQQTVNRDSDDYAYVSLLNTVLGGFFGSRLMSNLREEKGYTYGVYSYIQTYKRAAYFTVATEVKADATKSALDEIRKEINLLKTEEVPEHELEIVKNYISGSVLRSFDGPIALSDRFITVKDFGFTFKHYVDVLNKMINATPGQLIETANKYFDEENMIELVVGKM